MELSLDELDPEDLEGVGREPEEESEEELELELGLASLSHWRPTSASLIASGRPTACSIPVSFKAWRLGFLELLQVVYPPPPSNH